MSIHHNRSILLLATLALLGASLPTLAQDAPPKPETTPEKPTTEPKTHPTKFTRFVQFGKDEGRFETSIVSYEDAKGRKVDLIGAVHIGDRAYYRALNKRFENYESLLYELVAPKGTIPTPGRKGGGLVGMLQRGMKTMLDLEFQLDGIDYTPDNFVHADVSPAEYAALQKQRGESMLKTIINFMLEGMKNAEQMQSSASILDLIQAFFSEDSSRALKFIFAKELDNLERMLAAFGGPNGSESVIIGDRNAKAFEVLEKQLEAGKKKLGIFYGAAHLPDMEERLLKLGFKKKKVEWVTAWDVMKKKEV